MTKFMKVVVMVFLSAMAIGLLIAVASLLMYAIAFMLVALVAAVVLAPNDLKAMVSQLTGVFDKGLGRIEALWQDIKATLDQWGTREMAKGQTVRQGQKGFNNQAQEESKVATKRTLEKDG